MAGLLSDKKPCTVHTGRGFSVSYKDRLLYSKYDPQKSILQTVDSLNILSGTLVLCFSPCLWYGMGELLQKIPKGCRVLACEADDLLYEFAKNELDRNPALGDHVKKNDLVFLTPAQFKNLPYALENSSSSGCTDGFGMEGHIEAETRAGFAATSDIEAVAGIERSGGSSSGFTVAHGTGQSLERGVEFSNDLTAAPAIRTGNVKRILRIDFSAGVQFDEKSYDGIYLQCQKVISQFWKNRLTLVKFGRLYSKNIFQNLARLTRKKSVPFRNLGRTISKPILICGTGESLEKTLCTLKKFLKTRRRKDIYLIAVDASLPVLCSHNIEADAVVAVESQLAIEKAYIGIPGINGKLSAALAAESAAAASGRQEGRGDKKAANAKEISDRKGQKSKIFTLFADMTSRPHITDITSGNVCYFVSEYDKNDFMKRLFEKNLLPKVIPPLGSVGLTAVHIALLLRSSDEVPVFVTGMDFSYSVGKTHANGSAPHNERLFSHNRINSLGNYGAAFGNGSFVFTGNDEKKRITTLVLSNYAKNFALCFSGVKNLWNIGENALDIGIPSFAVNKDFTFAAGQAPGASLKAVPEWNPRATSGTTALPCGAPPPDQKNCRKRSAISAFFETEKAALERLKGLLTGEIKAAGQTPQDLGKEIISLLSGRSYLYLHFPDGHTPSLELSFLKRIRSEIDLFLKNVTLAQKILETQDDSV
ncbi:DUF115 domain-containing protein [Treponema parvum]|uniref:DUF115 domain-containing protein n=1 Tax=Treponema parvum TaxID=138851 RepID=A0A975EZG2_9SPIR|nr:6-hydroxymethylpterin diphosphokinase MptE-like protein [Treponema parvum]QTQ11500.1 DUF115 domain-containing protein [Treponema parvum]QTQ16552.1 DUF115 domain-containing protein [Treponema parvum]